ncbi:MAG: hypothetical protein DDT19_02882 [Syntrophomonadaceae bacterium]|nr:hypothetical protein [Bacillota bacterium]
MKTFLCTLCREKTHGAYSEGGILMAICEECYKKFYGNKKKENRKKNLTFVCECDTLFI